MAEFFRSCRPMCQQMTCGKELLKRPVEEGVVSTALLGKQPNLFTDCVQYGFADLTESRVIQLHVPELGQWSLNQFPDSIQTNKPIAASILLHVCGQRLEGG
jgi:hypothetical protein